MVHTKRRFCVGDALTIDELAAKFDYTDTWTGCTGFRVREGARVFLFLNDSFTEDSLQEYGVCLEEAGGVTQVESYTITWMREKRSLVTHFRALVEGLDRSHFPMRKAVLNPIESPQQHGRCHSCA